MINTAELSLNKVTIEGEESTPKTIGVTRIERLLLEAPLQMASLKSAIDYPEYFGGIVTKRNFPYRQSDEEKFAAASQIYDQCTSFSVLIVSIGSNKNLERAINQGTSLVSRLRDQSDLSDRPTTVGIALIGPDILAVINAGDSKEAIYERVERNSLSNILIRPVTPAENVDEYINVFTKLDFDKDPIDSLIPLAEIALVCERNSDYELDSGQRSRILGHFERISTTSKLLLDPSNSDVLNELTKLVKRLSETDRWSFSDIQRLSAIGNNFYTHKDQGTSIVDGHGEKLNPFLSQAELEADLAELALPRNGVEIPSLQHVLKAMQEQARKVIPQCGFYEQQSLVSFKKAILSMRESEFRNCFGLTKANANKMLPQIKSPEIAFYVPRSGGYSAQAAWHNAQTLADKHHISFIVSMFKHVSVFNPQ